MRQMVISSLVRVFLHISGRHQAARAAQPGSAVYLDAQFHRQFNTNVLGMFLMIEAALPASGAEGGSIINIGSETIVTANPTLSIYVASKSAVNGLTRVLSKESAREKSALTPSIPVEPKRRVRTRRASWEWSLRSR
jgi:NAD(P)-dependent dehydrogenase (short-subunit alcohol dehydrogenase family)